LKPAGKSISRDLKRWLPGVLISLVALFVLSRLVRGQDLKAAFAALDPFTLVVVAGTTVLFTVLRAFASMILLNGKPTFRQAFLAINERYLLNNIFPLRAGEVGRAIFLGRATGLNPFHVLSTVVIERAFDLAIAAGLLLSTLPLALGMEWARGAAIIVLVLVIAGLTVLFLMARYHEIVGGWVTRLGSRSEALRKYVVPQVLALLQGFGALTRPQQFLFSLLLILGSWLFAILQYYLMLLPIVPSAPLWWGIFTDAVLALGIAIPSAPGSLGVFEGAIVAALAILGISSSAALAYAISLHFIQIVVTGVIGLYGLIREGQSLGDLCGELRVRKETNG
jgi:uncharacterized protein (TIRG00374 family)